MKHPPMPLPWPQEVLKMFLFVLNQDSLLGGNKTGMRSTWIERGRSLRGNFRLEVELLYEYSAKILGEVLGENATGRWS